MKEQQLIIESLLFVASEPLLQSDIDRVFDGEDTTSLDKLIKDINLKYDNHAFEIKGLEGYEGKKLTIKKEHNIDSNFFKYHHEQYKKHN